MGKLKRYLLGLTMALNQFANALLGGNPDEALSSRLGRARENGSKVGQVVCAVIEFIDLHEPLPDEGDHCDRAMEHHLERLLRDANAAQPKSRSNEP